MSVLTHAQLLDLVTYDPESGEFNWVKSGPGKSIIKRAGSLNDVGYRRITVEKVNYSEHRLAWFYMTSKWPEKTIDHIDGNPSNNAFSNLREASLAENSQNQKAHRNSSTGFTGVTKFRNKWQAQIQVGNATRHLGLHNSAEAAHAAYVDAKKRFHAFHGTTRPAALTNLDRFP